MHVSTLTIGDIERGTARLDRRGDAGQAAVFAAWLDDIVDAFGGRIVPVTVDVAKSWGRDQAARSAPAGTR